MCWSRNLLQRLVPLFRASILTLYCTEEALSFCCCRSYDAKLFGKHDFATSKVSLKCSLGFYPACFWEQNIKISTAAGSFLLCSVNHSCAVFCRGKIQKWQNHSFHPLIAWRVESSRTRNQQREKRNFNFGKRRAESRNLHIRLQFLAEFQLETIRYFCVEQWHSSLLSNTFNA